MVSVDVDPGSDVAVKSTLSRPANIPSVSASCESDTATSVKSLIEMDVVGMAANGEVV